MSFDKKVNDEVDLLIIFCSIMKVKTKNKRTILIQEVT